MSNMRTYDELVQISARLSCGCRQRKGKPVPLREAAVWPGRAVICDKHEEYAVVTRISTSLYGERTAIANLLEATGAVDRETAECIADEQTA